MTDRHAAYIVILERDMRDDDAAAVAEALGMVRGVLKVTAVVADAVPFVYTTRRDLQWREALGRLAVDGPDGAGR